MGTIIQFPTDVRRAQPTRTPGRREGATIVILPSVRIERHAATSDGAPAGSHNTTPRSPRRRGSR